MDSRATLNYGSTNRKEMANLVRIARSYWLQNLKGHFPYWHHGNPISGSIPTGPAARAWNRFRDFTSAVIDVLENDDETASNFIVHGFLDSVYLGMPREFTQKFVTAAYLEHPLGNSPSQIQFVALVAIQTKGPELPMLEKARFIEHCLRDWKNGAYALENVFSDPSPNWLFTHGHSVRILHTHNAQALVDEDTECSICTEAFEADPSSPKFPSVGPCGHVICHECFNSWMTQVCYGHWYHTTQKRTFTCPMCRQCLCCGENNCEFHVLDHDERVPPVTLSAMLDQFLGPHATTVGLSGGAASPKPALRNFTPEQYHALRRRTRGDRAELAWVRNALALGNGEADFMTRYFEEEHDALLDKLRATITSFKDKPHGCYL
jgi:hypothetical protein